MLKIPRGFLGINFPENELEFFKIEDLEKFVKTGSFSVKEPALGIE